MGSYPRQHLPVASINLAMSIPELELDILAFGEAEVEEDEGLGGLAEPVLIS